MYTQVYGIVYKLCRTGPQDTHTIRQLNRPHPPRTGPQTPASCTVTTDPGQDHRTPTPSGQLNSPQPPRTGPQTPALSGQLHSHHPPRTGPQDTHTVRTTARSPPTQDRTTGHPDYQDSCTVTTHPKQDYRTPTLSGQLHGHHPPRTGPQDTQTIKTAAQSPPTQNRTTGHAHYQDNCSHHPPRTGPQDTQTIKTAAQSPPTQNRTTGHPHCQDNCTVTTHPGQDHRTPRLSGQLHSHHPGQDTHTIRTAAQSPPTQDRTTGHYQDNCSHHPPKTGPQDTHTIRTTAQSPPTQDRTTGHPHCQDNCTVTTNPG